MWCVAFDLGYFTTSDITFCKLLLRNPPRLPKRAHLFNHLHKNRSQTKIVMTELLCMHTFSFSRSLFPFQNTHKQLLFTSKDSHKQILPLFLFGATAWKLTEFKPFQFISTHFYSFLFIFARVVLSLFKSDRQNIMSDVGDDNCETHVLKGFCDVLTGILGNLRNFWGNLDGICFNTRESLEILSDSHLSVFFEGFWREFDFEVLLRP